MSAHKYLDCFIAMAERAKECDTPWDCIQSAWIGRPDNWNQCLSLPDFDDTALLFRIKPRTIMINGIEVNEPLRVAPPDGTIVWEAHKMSNGDTGRWHYGFSWPHVVNLLINGRLHLTEENARAHYEADYAGSRERK